MLTMTLCSGHVVNKPMTPDALHKDAITVAFNWPFLHDRIKTINWWNICNTNCIKNKFNLNRSWGYSIWLEKQTKKSPGSPRNLTGSESRMRK